jgi:hypothetical protein
MSQYPRRVLYDLAIAQGPAWVWSVRRGAVVDIQPGSQLEAWYGASNLSPVLTGSAISDAAAPCLDKSAITN